MFCVCVYALGTQAPLGAGFGNPLASAVGTSLGSSTLGGTASALNKYYLLFCPFTIYHILPSVQCCADLSPLCVFVRNVYLYESAIDKCSRFLSLCKS